MPPLTCGPACGGTCTDQVLCMLSHCVAVKLKSEDCAVSVAWTGDLSSGSASTTGILELVLFGHRPLLEDAAGREELGRAGTGRGARKVDPGALSPNRCERLLASKRLLQRLCDNMREGPAGDHVEDLLSETQRHCGSDIAAATLRS